MAGKFPLLLGVALAILLLVSQDVAHAQQGDGHWYRIRWSIKRHCSACMHAGEGGQIPEGYGPYTQPGWGGSTPYNPPEKKSMRGGGQMGKNGSGSYP
ncbi:unnamed protein product [Alopecurus aequalis]